MVGAFLTNEVATTIGEGVFDASAMDQLVVIASLVGATLFRVESVPTPVFRSVLRTRWSAELS